MFCAGRLVDVVEVPARVVGTLVRAEELTPEDLVLAMLAGELVLCITELRVAIVEVERVDDAAKLEADPRDVTPAIEMLSDVTISLNGEEVSHLPLSHRLIAYWMTVC